MWGLKLEIFILIAHNFYQADLSAYHLSLSLFLSLTLRVIENKKACILMHISVFHVILPIKHASPIRVP